MSVPSDRPPPRCEYTYRRSRWPFVERCRVLAQTQVRLYEHDGTTRTMDLCSTHVEEAADEYPDNIKALVSYR